MAMHKTCDNCKYERRTSFELPCQDCTPENRGNFWEPSYAVLVTLLIDKDERLQELERLSYTAADTLVESVDGHKEYDYDTRAGSLATEILKVLKGKK